MNLPNIDNAKVAILPVPIETTTSYKKGTKRGPETIIRASSELEMYDEELGLEPYKVGITTLNEIYELEELENLKTDKFVIALGGEHTITLPIVKRFPEEKLSILHIDAHADLKNVFDGEKLSHACVMRRIAEFNKKIVQFGIRSLSKEEHEFIQRNNIKTFFMKDLVYDSNYIREILNSLSEDVYITIDVDAFDPSVISEVGNPEPGGIRWYQLLTLLKYVFKEKNVVGVDIVEFSPRKETNSDFILAKLIYKIIGYKFN